MQNIQNKIDRLIQNGNNEFSEQRNVVAALVEYSRCLDLYDFLDRSYKIQLHEVLVRIAISYDILGNFNKTLDYLNKALNIVPNVGALVLFKSVLLQTLGKTDDAQKILIKFKQISGKKKLDLYETFRLVFYYSMGLEKEVLLREINDYLLMYSKNAVVLYLRAMIYLDLSNNNGNYTSNSQNNTNLTSANLQSKKNQKNEFYLKYENDLKEALALEPNDTEYLIKDGITNENLTKLFFMILPEMDFYQPKPLVNYTTFHSGLRIFYIIFKAIRMLKIKVEKKKIKNYYNNKLKLYKKKAENIKSDNSPDISSNYSSNSFLNPTGSELKDTTDGGGNSTNPLILNKSSNTGNNTNNTSDLGNLANEINLNSTTGNTRLNKILKTKTKSISNLPTERSKPLQNQAVVAVLAKQIPPLGTILNIKNNVDKANLDEIISEIKKEYEVKVKSLYKTVWLCNLRMSDYNFLLNFENVDVDTNYFIKNKYYAPYNIKETIISAVKQNIEYKSNLTYQSNQTQSNFNKKTNVILGNDINYKNINKKNEKNEIIDFSVSEINHNKNEYRTNITDNNILHNDMFNQDSISFSSDINILENNSNNVGINKQIKEDELDNKKKLEINGYKKMQKDK